MSADKLGADAPHVVVECRGDTVSVNSWHDDKDEAWEARNDVRYRNRPEETPSAIRDRLRYLIVPTARLSTSRPQAVLESLRDAAPDHQRESRGNYPH